MEQEGSEKGFYGTAERGQEAIPVIFETCKPVVVSGSVIRDCA